MARPGKAKNGTPRRSSPRTTARRSVNANPQTVAGSSKGAPENAAPKPSETSAPTSRIGAPNDETLIVDETEELLRQGITGVAIIGIRRPPREAAGPNKVAGPTTRWRTPQP